MDSNSFHTLDIYKQFIPTGLITNQAASCRPVPVVHVQFCTTQLFPAGVIVPLLVIASLLTFHTCLFLSQWHCLVAEMESEMRDIVESAGLFEVSLPDYRQLKACRREVGLLKTLWDMVLLVRLSFQEWTKTLWLAVNVENLDIDCKKFVKELRLLDREMRSWDAFLGLESLVKNMVTSLRSVGELQSKAIRERHWQQLMQATKVTDVCTMCG